jgi:CBS domain-containing protein
MQDNEQNKTGKEEAMNLSTDDNLMLIPTPKDIMTKNIITVTKDTPIYDAMELFVKYDISGMPVVDEDMNLIGVLSEKDLMNLVDVPEDEQDKTVSDLMTQPALYFEEDESLLDICHFLKKNVFRRVPITSKGKLVGIISIRDIIEFILRLNRHGNDEVVETASSGNG